MVKIFSHCIGSLFTFLIVSFAVKKLRSLNPSHLSILGFTSCTLGILITKCVPKPTWWKYGPTCTRIRPRVSDLVPPPLIRFELIFMHDEREAFYFFLVGMDFQFS